MSNVLFLKVLTSHLKLHQLLIEDHEMMHGWLVIHKSKVWSVAIIK